MYVYVLHMEFLQLLGEKTIFKCKKNLDTLHTKRQQRYEELFIISNYQGNVNFYHSRLLLHICYNRHYF